MKKPASESQPTTPPSPKLHRNVWATSGTSFLTDVSSEMLLNVLPLFLANVLGVRIWAIGLVEGFAEATSSILKLYSGWLSDRLGTRKWPAVVGYGISAVSKPFYYLASSWGAVAAIRWGDRVGKGVRTAPRDALLADSTPAGRRGFAFGLHRAADTAGAVIGIAVSIWVVQQVQGGGALLEAETFRKLVLWSLLPAFLGVAVLAVGARDVKVDGSDGRGNGGKGRGGNPGAASAASRPRLRLRGLGRGFGAFVACSVIFELGNSADAFLVLRAQERGLSVAGILWLLLAFNVVYTLVSTPAGSLADRIPRKRVVAAAWGLYALVYPRLCARGHGHARHRSVPGVRLLSRARGGCGKGDGGRPGAAGSTRDGLRRLRGGDRTCHAAGFAAGRCVVGRPLRLGRVRPGRALRLRRGDGGGRGGTVAAGRSRRAGR